MVTYKPLVQPDALCVGAFANPVSNQFSQVKGNTTLYLFYVKTIDDGLHIVNPTDGENAINTLIPLDEILKVKVVATGKVVEAIKTESVTKEEIVKYFTETDEPAIELVDTVNVGGETHTFVSMTISKGSVSLSTADGKTILPITDLSKQTTIKLEKEKKK